MRQGRRAAASVLLTWRPLPIASVRFGPTAGDDLRSHVMDRWATRHIIIPVVVWEGSCVV